MSRIQKRGAIAVAVLAVVVGAIVAVVSSKGTSHHPARSALARAEGRRVERPSELAVAARYLGLSTSQLNEQLRSGRTLAQIAGATNGRSASGLIDALLSSRAARLRAGAAGSRRSAANQARRLANVRRRITAQVDRTVGYGQLSASARYLGVTVAKLRLELQGGQSLAQIADATTGRSAAGLIDARVKMRETTLVATLATHEITSDAEHALLSRLRKQVTAEVQRKPSS
jgi:hypothetical protein